MIFVWSPFRRKSQGKGIRSCKDEIPTGDSLLCHDLLAALNKAAQAKEQRTLHGLWGGVEVALLLKQAQYHRVYGTLDGEGGILVFSSLGFPAR